MGLPQNVANQKPQKLKIITLFKNLTENIQTENNIHLTAILI